MPSVAQEMPTMLSCKKRARDDIDITTPQISLYAESLAKSTISIPDHLFDRPTSEPPSNHFAVTPLSVPFHQHRSSPLKRKIIPFPSIQRQRIYVDEKNENGEDREMRLGSSPSQDQPDGNKHDDNTLDSQQQQAARATTTSSAANLMARCHICSRKPAKKSDLELFTDCQGCGQRACDICMRECFGWRPILTAGSDNTLPLSTGLATGEVKLPDSNASFTMVDVDADEVSEQQSHRQHTHRLPRSYKPRPGDADEWARRGHRERICSRCCIEKGPDGDIVCLGCLPFVKG
jgi:hypothetical protein